MVEDIEKDFHPNWAINRPDFEPQVSFNEFNTDSLNIVVFYWYHPPDYWEYLNHATWINTQIMERFNAEGIDFAFPTQTLHLAGDEKRPLDIGQRRVPEEESFSPRTNPAQEKTLDAQAAQTPQTPAGNSVRAQVSVTDPLKPKASGEQTGEPPAEGG
jgi:MscS family membrane protein